MEDVLPLTTAFEFLAKGAYLDVLLPKASNFDAATFIKDGSPEELARAPSRRNLFFGTRRCLILSGPAYSDTGGQTRR